MCNSTYLFMSMADYTGSTKHVMLSDGLIKASNNDINTIEIKVATDKVIYIHNVIYVMTLNVSLFSVKQHMKYIG